MWYKNIAGRFFGLVTKHTCDRRTDDGQMDRQNYDSQDRASIASRGKNRNRAATEVIVNRHEKLNRLMIAQPAKNY